MHSDSEILQNTPKYTFGYNRCYWVCSCEKLRRDFGNRKQCILVLKRTSFSSFCMHSGSEMLQNTPKYQFGSNGRYWVCSCERFRGNFGIPKQCILVPKRTSFSSFSRHSVSEMLQNTPKHHFGS